MNKEGKVPATRRAIQLNSWKLQEFLRIDRVVFDLGDECSNHSHRQITLMFCVLSPEMYQDL